MLVLHAPRMCASPGLRHAYAALHAGLLHAAGLTPPDAEAPSPAGERLCAAVYHPVLILAGNALVGHLAFCVELCQRRAFVRQNSAAAGRQGALLASLRRRGQLPVECLDYWLLFSLPAACTLTFLHLRLNEL